MKGFLSTSKDENVPLKFINKSKKKGTVKVIIKIKISQSSMKNCIYSDLKGCSFF